jgi:hypothetical protein
MLCFGSNAKFQQHLPAILLIHVSAISREDVYPENNREALTKFCSGSGAEHRKTNPIYTYSGGIRTYLYLLASRLHGHNKTDKPD